MTHRLLALVIFLTVPACIAASDEIGGVVIGHDGEPVPDATLILCDQATGIPFSTNTFQPFHDRRVGIVTVLDRRCDLEELLVQRALRS